MCFSSSLLLSLTSKSFGSWAAAVVVAAAAGRCRCCCCCCCCCCFWPCFFCFFSLVFLVSTNKKLLKIDRQLHKCTYTIQQLSAEKANIRQIHLSNQMSATCFGHDKMYEIVRNGCSLSINAYETSKISCSLPLEKMTPIFPDFPRA